MLMSSTRLQHVLKIVSVMGMVFNVIGALILFIAYFVTDFGDIWVGIWFMLSVGLPLFAIMYAGLKLREYLRDILAELAKKQG